MTVRTLPSLTVGALTAVLAASLACPAPPKPCHAADGLAGTADQVAVAQGGRVTIAMPKVDGVVVTLAGLAPGFAERQTDAGFVVGAPYDIAGSVPVRMVATCTDDVHDTAIHPFTLEVRAPVIHAITASSTSQGPVPRSLPAFAVVGGALVVVGGTSASEANVNDAWSLDLESGAWSPLPNVLPPPSPARAVGVDDHTAVLLAADGNAYTLDVASSSVTPLAQASSPSARGAFVPASSSSGAFVSFCGVATASACAVSALVVGDGTAHWSSVSPTGFSPTGRAGVAYGFDDEGNRAVLFGGQSDDGTISAESWSLDTTHVPQGSVTFAHLATKGLDPPERVDSCGVVDPVGRRFFIFGGRDANGVVTTPWALDLDHDDARWRPVALDGLPARAGCSAVYDAAHTRILVGFGDDGEAERADVYAIDL